MEELDEEFQLKYKMTNVHESNKANGEVSVPKGTTGIELKQKLAAITGIPAHLQKILVKGKIIKDEAKLDDLKLKSGSLLLIMKKDESSSENFKKEEENIRTIESLTETARKVSKRNEDDLESGRHLEILNQNGEMIRLSPQDEENLKVGMTLHEKGKVYMRKEEWENAIEILKKADEAFVQCSSDFLSAIDNYGLLCLDLVWCFFKKKNIQMLSEADWRLHKAEESLEKSYGKQFERLIALKGSSGPEMILFFRLFLLRGIVAFHKSMKEEAKSLFQKAEQSLNVLYVDEENMSTLIGMGFTARESRIALRRHKNVEQAIASILFKREEKRKMIEEEKEKRRKRKEKRKYGKTVDGFWVDSNLVQSLSQLGFQQDLVVKALKQTNNNQDASFVLLSENSSLLQVKDEKKPSKQFKDEIAYIETMGFSSTQALGTLQQTNGNVEMAVELLVSGNGSEATPEEVAVHFSSMKEEKRESRQREDKQEKEEEALFEGIDNDDEEGYLDLSLEDEKKILKDYIQKVQ